MIFVHLVFVCSKFEIGPKRDYDVMKNISGSTIFVIPFIITWSAHSSGVSQLVSMYTVCGLLVSTNFVITIFAKTFSVMLSLSVDAIIDPPVFHSRSSKCLFVRYFLLIHLSFFLKIFWDLLAVDFEVKYYCIFVNFLNHYCEQGINSFF